MNEPKRRGRPTKAEQAAKAALIESVRLDPPGPCEVCGRAVGHYDDCERGMGVMDQEQRVSLPVAESQAPAPEAGEGGLATIRAGDVPVAAYKAAAQAYAQRVWNGQSPDVPRAERIRRVQRALEGQNLPFEGVQLP